MDTTKTLASRLRNSLELATTLAVLVAAIVFLWKTTQREAPATANGPDRSIPVPKDRIPLNGAPTLGSAQAKVALLEFADFECPYCGRFVTNMLPELKAKYVDTGKVMFVFRHNPLTAIHPRAEAAAQASECAVAQGKFWDLHDHLFKDPRKLQEADLLGYAREVRLDVDGFKACLADGIGERVRQDARLAQTLRLTGTPVFMIGRVLSSTAVSVSQVLTGVRPIAEFHDGLERALKTTTVAN